MTIASELDQLFRRAISAAFDIDADPMIAATADDKFGDYQSNAAMGLAKKLRMNPRAVAEQIKAKLELGDLASEISIAGPGFINVRLNPEYISRQLQARLLQQAGLASTSGRAGSSSPSPGIPGEGRGEGESEIRNPKSEIRKSPHPNPLPEYRERGQMLAETRAMTAISSSGPIVVVDYSGPNIAKEMHVGHLRSTIIGDAISRVLEFQGFNVIRQNHVGDWGTQFGMLIEYLKEKEFQAGGLDIADLEEFYRQAKQRFDESEEFQSEARSRVVALQAGEEYESAAWKQIVNETRRTYQPIYGRLLVKLTAEHERGESYYNPFLPEVVAELKAKGLAEQSQGATVVPTPGYENPLIIEKSGGGYLYATTDLAAIRFRVRELHANRIIYTHDSRQSQHFAQVFDVARRAGFAPPEVELDYAPFGTMLGEDGKPFKTRTGGTIKLKDLLEEAEQRAREIVDEKNPEMPEEQRQQIARAVGIGAVKYADLSKDRTSDYVFSWSTMLAMDGNTAPYLQYAHARIRSIFRRAAERRIVYEPAEINLQSLFELALAKHVLRFGDAVELVSRELKPHYLCTYLFELATKFSGFFENCPVLQSDEQTRASRLTLCEITAGTLAQGLDLLGIEHPEQM